MPTRKPTLRAELQRAYSADYGKRQLIFLASRAVSPATLAKTLPAIVPTYNAFDARLVCDWLVTNAPRVAVWFGREYSPVMYIAGTAADLATIERNAHSVLAADEVYTYPAPDKSGDSLRLWWD